MQQAMAASSPQCSRICSSASYWMEEVVIKIKFMRAGKVVNAFEGPDLQRVQAISSDRKHLAILVSYSGLTKEIIEPKGKTGDSFCRRFRKYKEKISK